MRRVRTYVVVVADPSGQAGRYFFTATSLRRVSSEARKWVAAWEGARLLEITQADEVGTDTRRLVAVACIAFVSAGALISATMFVALSLQM